MKITKQKTPHGDNLMSRASNSENLHSRREVYDNNISANKLVVNKKEETIM